MSKRVLFVSHSSHLYGGQRSLLDLVVGLQVRRAVEPLVVTPPGPLVALLRQAGVAVLEHEVPWWIERDDATTAGRAGRTLRTLRTALGGRRAAASISDRVRGWGPTAVHTNVLATEVGHLVARRLVIPHVWHVREFVEEDLGHRFIRGRTASLAKVRKASTVLFNSEAVRRRFADELGDVPSRVVYNGFRFRSAETPRVASGGGARLLLVGHLRPGKGHLDAIEALAELHRRGLPATLRLAGSGRPGWETRLRGRCAELGLTGHVAFLGQVPDLAAEYAAADVALACSPHEPFGRIVIEAFDHGVPVVAADAAGFRETVTDGVTGRLYPPGDPGRLADAIAATLQDAARARRMAAQGRTEAVRRFSLDGYVETVEGILLGLS